MDEKCFSETQINAIIKKKNVKWISDDISKAIGENL